MYKWQEKAFEQVLALRARLPHALLIRGPEGTGIEPFGAHLAQSLLCERPAEQGRACGKCLACNWFLQGNHPDFRLVQPDSLGQTAEEAGTSKERASEQIRIDQIRALQDFLSVGTHRAGLRIVMLHPADTMNTPTQNALLKNLEEPAAHTLFLLVSSFSHRLLATVRSRCQAITLPKPSTDSARQWLLEQGVSTPESLLSISGGAPLLALELANRSEFITRLIDQLSDPEMDPVTLAGSCQGTDPAELITALYRWCYDLLSSRLAGRVRYYAQWEPAIRTIAARCQPERIAAYLRSLAQARSLAQHPLNARLFIEDILLRYHGAIYPLAADVG